MSITVPVLGKVSFEPVHVYRNLVGGSGVPEILRWPEAATQTFKTGAPLALSSGFLVEWDGGAADIVGFAVEPGHNLTTSGVAQDGVSEGTAPNQASSKIIPIGAWVRDGKIGFIAADGRKTFAASTDIPTATTHGVFVQTMVISGTFYGLTKDSTSGFWYVDTLDTAGNNAVCQVLGYDPSSPNSAANGCRLEFVIDPARRYFEN